MSQALTTSNFPIPSAIGSLDAYIGAVNRVPMLDVTDDLDLACELALQNQYPNPRPLEKAAIRQLLQDAFEGNRPAS